MKQYFIIAAFFAGAPFLFSCSPQSKRIEGDYGTEMAASKYLQVELSGKVLLRRTYASIQSIRDEKEREAYLDKQQASNPELYNALCIKDSILIKQFAALGLMKDNGFLINNFKPQTTDTCSLLTELGEKLQFYFYSDSATGKIWFNIFYKSDSLQINTDATTLQKLDYAFLDVIPGGNKELVFLDDYYLMNGDNFDFLVFEIKTK